MPLAALALPPQLREGDRLSGAEFMRLWEAMPDLKQAELIAGIVFMPSPVSIHHSRGHKEMYRWVLHYEDLTPGCESGFECTWLMGPKDVPQPDIFLRVLPEYGGQSGEEGIYAAGAPELIVEVTGSSVARDLGVKLELYRRAGVREYVTAMLHSRQIIWRQLVRGRYREIKPDDDGLLRSAVFPGLWLDPAAVWNPAVSIRTAVEKGVQSPAHDIFVRRLAAKLRK